MKAILTTASLVAALFFLIMLGGGILVWLAPVPVEQVTPAQDRLIDLADTVVKGSAGAFIGLVVSRLTIAKNGGSSSG